MSVTHFQMYIDGTFTDGESRDTVAVENPATEEIFATVPAGTIADADRAIAAARRAQPEWSRRPAIERGRMVRRLASAILDSREHLARIVVAEQGKPISQARGEIDATAMFLEYAGEQARRIQGEILPSDHREEDVWIRRVPYGVVAALTAWNYPSALAGRKLGPALTAGNSVVLKGHEITPLSGLEIARIAHDLGFPPGVINVITGGGRSVGQHLVESRDTDLVTMTGSVRAGREIFAAAAPGLKPIRLELGGKAPFIVLEDADLDRAVDAAIVSRFTNCGQICTCAERIYVHRSLADAFISAFVARAKALRLADPMSDPDMGPKVSRPELEKIENIVSRAVAGGAEILTGGNRPGGDLFGRGHWYLPTVMLAPADSLLVREEIFGPIAPIRVIDGFEEALAEANASDYGLSAYVFTRNLRRVMQSARDLAFGEIYVNRGCGELVQGFHCGWKNSGLGGEDGQHGFEGYLRRKTMYVSWSD
ncbi:aldehyde dehydrogenase family protein [Tabrizicola sp. J26]|uniref:aldehyde dehydrogenase family protein n=1 Tax=Alitabrizicola rongguiensis TaxID=2909234 RepID=UPI001F16AC9E|nr:aldehyde dehydrogenase family protein [Tabrizicola rongguiensis]MCF1711117.1 aldehyde dehydrogenase family protein [Tabrizicola rongguiensis]